ncbi:toprim domain-containing protein [Paraburkholderia aspalathi]|uniref:Toprim-like n=1 Tax=Paraburkholderia aspalathi TaxID=1324617 RepID=A0A1I7EL97_9BURK|nr:toprim domain-containing protein [Paraburkholderia aspalathi]SFU24700.1 Toprim-like [Paraburkholderia aspalathi]
MRASLHHDITQRLLADYGFKHAGAWLQQGRCPACEKKELHAHADAPWVLKCGRLNNCGAQFHVKDLYRDLFESWSDRFKPTPTNPNAAADAYLRDARAFDLERIRGWYAQDSYWNGQLKAGSATVRFPLPAGGYWERIIDRPERFGKRKANFNGSYGGTWWEAPGADLTRSDEVWIVEGIFDAIALLHHGITAVSALSCTNYPAKALELLRAAVVSGKCPRLVWALDADKAGQSATRKWVERARADGWTAVAAQIPQRGRDKLDWNDMHQRKALAPADIKEYRYHGDLLLVDTPTDKARLIYNHDGYNAFSFIHHGRLYWFKLDLERYAKARELVEKTAKFESEDELREHAVQQASTVTTLANCVPTALYFQEKKVTDESWYYFHIDGPDKGDVVKNTFTGTQLASTAEFKKRLLSIAPGAVFTGTTQQLDHLMVHHWGIGLKRVKTIDFIGYSSEHECYVFQNTAIKGGEVYALNDEDYFDIGPLSIKSVNHSVSLALNADTDNFSTAWLNPLWKAFGAKGVVALAFWLGTLFAEQIRAKHKSYPFFELIGEPGSGKTTMLEFLWKLVGRLDYEGFDPSKSSLAGRARNMSQVGNLPVVLIEGDRGDDGNKAKGFDWDELKTAYNGRSVRARGTKTSGNETDEPPFRGSIVISQNAKVEASEAVMQRIVHVRMDRATQTAETRAAAGQLEQWPIDQLSGFAITAAKNEAQVLEQFFERFTQYRDELAARPDIRTGRIAMIHGQMRALVDALELVIPLTAEQREATHAELGSMALERQRSISTDHPLVEDFWEAFDYLDAGEASRLNHSHDPDLIAISLRHFEQVAQEHKLRITPLVDLKRVLKTSRARKYVDQKVVRSAINERRNLEKHLEHRPEAVRCWIFEKPKNRTA